MLKKFGVVVSVAVGGCEIGKVVESHLVIRNAKSSGCFTCKRSFGRDSL